MIILNNEEISAVLSMDNCLRFLERAYLEQAQGTAVNRPRSDMYLPAATSGGVYCFKTMEGALTQEKVVALRLNSDVIRWEERGGPLAIFPDGFIQGLRVAASSALAARFLAREDAALLGILGSGWQARAHAKAMCAVRAIKKILVHSPTKTNRENFAAEVEKELGILVEAVVSGESVADRADILVAATNSVSRVVPPEWLKPGMHVTCVKITELGEETLRKADRLVIHARKFAPENYIAGYGDEKIECHDPIDLLTESGKGSNVTPKEPFWLGAPELKDVISGKAPGRQAAKEITCFNNNIGLGIQFAAIGKAIFDDAKAKGLGREIPTDWFLETVHP